VKWIKSGLRYLLGALFVFAGINHFRDPDFYINIMPLYMPFHRELVLLSGVTEIVAGAMLFFRPTIRWGAWGIIAMLVVFFTVHIDMIIRADDFANVPLWALYFRIVLQFVFIAWAWWFTRPDMQKLETATA